MVSLVCVTSETDASPETKFPLFEFADIMRHGSLRQNSDPKAINKRVSIQQNVNKFKISIHL